MLKSCEAFFVYTHLNIVNLIPFTKRFESSENLVDLLESRGLQICDRNKAIQYLDNIGYYRLSAYMYPLLKMPKTAHLYKKGSSFKKVMMLYRFDKKLRLLMFNEIEKIEIAIRRAVMQITADMTGNPFWLTDFSYFLDGFKFNETMRAISKEYSKSKEEFILHFKRTYSDPYPPSWILGELHADFDVDYHEAIAMVPGMGDDKKGKVIDCVQTGYTLNDKVIRHAKVAVGQ